MNNTSKRTLSAIVVLIFTTATLVVGGIFLATSPSAAFAYQKKGGAQENSKNGNTATDQAAKQNAIESGFDNNGTQEVSDLICTNPSDICVQKGFTTGSGSALTPIPGPTGPQGEKGATGPAGPAGPDKKLIVTERSGTFSGTGADSQAFCNPDEVTTGGGYSNSGGTPPFINKSFGNSWDVESRGGQVQAYAQCTKLVPP
jgi:hypothetical protein